MSWAVGADGTLGFGGWWSAYVVRPIFLALVMGWLWRMLLVTYWVWRVGRLDLVTRADAPRPHGRAGVRREASRGIRDGGVCVVGGARVALGARGRSSRRDAGVVQAHGGRVRRPVDAVRAVAAASRSFRLIAARGRAIPAYAALVGEQGRLVHRRWILREPVDDTPILDAPEIGPVADAATMYDAVTRMRVAPIGKASIVKILVPIALPMIVVAALQIPVQGTAAHAPEGTGMRPVGRAARVAPEGRHRRVADVSRTKPRAAVSSLEMRRTDRLAAARRGRRIFDVVEVKS